MKTYRYVVELQMDQTRFELVTFSLRTKRSPEMSYWPKKLEAKRVELLTYGLQSHCSPIELRSRTIKLFSYPSTTYTMLAMLTYSVKVWLLMTTMFTCSNMCCRCPIRHSAAVLWTPYCFFTHNGTDRNRTCNPARGFPEGNMPFGWPW